MSEKEAALLKKIRIKADITLAGIEREMAVMGWAPALRALMWSTLSSMAATRATEAQQNHNQMAMKK